MFRLNSIVVLCTALAIQPALANSNPQQAQLDLYVTQTAQSYLQKLPSEAFFKAEKSTFLNQWVESSEIRVSAENDDDRSRSLALNLKIKNASELKVQQQLFDLVEASEQLEQQKTFNAHLHTTYQQLVELNNKLEQSAHLQSLLQLSGVEIKYQRGLVQSNDFDAENLLDSELNQEQVQQEIEFVSQQINDLKESLNFDTQQSFIDLEASQIIARIKSHSLKHGIEVKQAKMDLELAQLKLKQQQSNEGVALNAVQLSSDFGSGKDTVLGVRFDIQIPFAGPNYDNQLKHQGIAKATKRLHQRKKLAQLKAEQSLLKIQQYNNALNSNQKQARTIEQRLLKTTDVHLILKLKTQHLKRLGKSIDIRHNLQTSYIDFLAQRGLLASSEDNNWLSATLNSKPAE